MRYRMRYSRKPEFVDAIIFDYSCDGIKILKEFCGECLGDVSKRREMCSKGQVEICQSYLDRDGDKIIKEIAMEDDFIVRNQKGEIYVMSPDLFHTTYARVK